MITFFKQGTDRIYLVQSARQLSESDNERLLWLLGGGKPLKARSLAGPFVGPR